MNKLGERLKEQRLEKNLHQKQLADMLSVSQQTISYWESGIKQFDYDVLIKLANFFGVTTDYLLGVED